jgi:hypothetical protein
VDEQQVSESQVPVRLALEVFVERVKAAEGLDCYLNGLDTLIDWVHSGQDSLLEQARRHIARGDKTSEEVILLAFETQESFKETDEALMRSLGIDPEGIE